MLQTASIGATTGCRPGRGIAEKSWAMRLAGQAVGPMLRQSRRGMQGTVTGDARQAGRGLLGGDGL